MIPPERSTAPRRPHTPAVPLLTLSAGLALAPAAQAQTPKSGWISADETWSGAIEIVGDVMIADTATVDVAPGTTITFTADAASIYFPETNADAELRLLGTPTQRISVTTAPGVVPGRIGRFGTFYATGIHAEYVDFSNLGTSGNDFALFHGPREASDHFIVRHCTFTSCYTVHAFGYGTSALIEISDSDFRAGTDSALRLNGSTGSYATRLVRGNTSDGDFDLFCYRTRAVENVLFGVDVQMPVQVGAHEALLERNYVHNPVGDGPGSGIAIPVNRSDVIIRNNFVSGGQQSLSLKQATRAQVHDNVIQSVTDQHEHATGLPTDGLFARNILFGEPVISCLITSTPAVFGATVKNNVINGNDQPGLWLNHLNAVTGIANVRNNIFYDCANPIRGVIHDESGQADSLLAIDYNCFFSPRAGADNYDDSIALTSRTERQSPGFGRNDLTPGGAIDEQVDPLLANPIHAISIQPAEMMNRTRTIDDVLREARRAYALLPGSPCIDAGAARDNGDPDVRDGRRDIGLEYGPTGARRANRPLR